MIQTRQCCHTRDQSHRVAGNRVLFPNTFSRINLAEIGPDDGRVWVDFSDPILERKEWRVVPTCFIDSAV